MHATIMPLSSNYSPKGEPHASYLNQNPTEIISFLKDERKTEKTLGDNNQNACQKIKKIHHVNMWLLVREAKPISKGIFTKRW